MSDAHQRSIVELLVEQTKLLKEILAQLKTGQNISITHYNGDKMLWNTNEITWKGDKSAP